MYFKYNPAQKAFRSMGHTSVESGSGMNYRDTPKLKNIFIVRFELSPYAEQWIREQYDTYNVNRVTYMVKSTDRPSVTFENRTMNQYNRKRVHHTKVNYQPLNMTLYDNVDGDAMLLMAMYQKFYYGDFQMKTPKHWNYDLVSNAPTFEQFSDGHWGYSFDYLGDKDQTYFFKRISILEINNDVFTAYNIYNPKLSQIIPDTKSHDEIDFSTIDITFEYEGITYLYPSLANDQYEELLAVGRSTYDVNNLSELLFDEGSEFNKSGFFIQQSPFVDYDNSRTKKSITEGAGEGAIENFIYNVDEIIDDTLTGFIGNAQEVGNDIIGNVTTSLDDFINGNSGKK